ncbi:MAG: ABC transporter ATP-binding protein [Gemmatimonadales bacterium]
MTDAIHARGLTKRFGRLEVLKGLDLTLPRGRVTGLVGPNAAGKSTFIKSLLGLVYPDAGHLAVLGTHVNGDERYRHQLGYMPQAASFPGNLTGHEVLRMVQDLRPATPADPGPLVERFRLAGELGKPVRTLSGGTRQKLSAVVAFLFQPELLILDEPTAGLDPIASGVLKDLVAECRARGATVLLASHTLAELEEIADDIVFLLEGRVRFHGAVAELRALTGEQRLERAVATLMRENDR